MYPGHFPSRSAQTLQYMSLYGLQDIKNIRTRLAKSDLSLNLRNKAELNIDDLIAGKSTDQEVCVYD